MTLSLIHDDFRKLYVVSNVNLAVAVHITVYTREFVCCDIRVFVARLCGINCERDWLDSS